MAAGATGIDQQRPASELDPFLQAALQARQHGEMVERICVPRLAVEHLLVTAGGLAERALPVEQRGLLQQDNGRRSHRADPHVGAREGGSAQVGDHIARSPSIWPIGIGSSTCSSPRPSLRGGGGSGSIPK
jgi:hypothetical protein